METIIINGQQSEISVEQISAIVESGNAREHFKIRDVIEAFGRKLEVIGFDHDEDDETEGRHTMTVFEKETDVQRRMHGKECKRGWIDTELRQWLGEQFETLPDELQKAIRPVRKLTHNGQGEAFITVDKLFLPSESELFGSAIWSDFMDEERYEAFACCNDRVRHDKDGDRCWYWTRSSLGGNSTYFALVGSYGYPTYAGAAGTYLSAPLCFNF